MQRTVRRILLIAAAFALFVVPAAAIAAAGFTDVADDSVFVADIQWMKDNDITRGCNPPTNDRYCPSNSVTREQMSAFMHRLAVNQVVDAATAIQADNATTADHATTADNATDADTLDGMDSTDFLGVGDKAADAELLDGKNSSAFVYGASWVDDTWSFTGVGNDVERTVTLDCPFQKYPIAGGGAENGFNWVMTDSQPYFSSFTDRGWTIAWQNMSGGTSSASGTVWVLCADFDISIQPLAAESNEADPNS